jgi:hypothetical protein
MEEALEPHAILSKTQRYRAAAQALIDDHTGHVILEHGNS